MDLNPISARMLSVFLKNRGYTPHTMDSGKRWAGLTCRKSGDEVRIRAWQDIDLEEPSEDDRELIAEIAELLTDNGYKIRYITGNYALYVLGREK